MSDLKKAAETAVTQCMGIKPNEKVLIVTDKNFRDVGYAIFDASKKVTNDTVLIEIKPEKFDGIEPAPYVAKFIQNFDVHFYNTSWSLSHTEARRNAAKKRGTRVASMPEVSVEIFERTMNVDYEKIKKLTEKISEILTEAELVELKTVLGTDIKIPIKGYRGYVWAGICREKGKFINLPDGEACIVPQDGKSNGVIFFDGSFPYISPIKTPIKATIEDGYCVKLEGGKEAEKLKKMLCNYGDKKISKNNPACFLAEFGIGTNFAAKLSGLITEDEKVYKTVHLAFGNSVMFGGSNDVELHLDGVVTKPDLWIDGKQLMDKGEFLI